MEGNYGLGQTPITPRGQRFNDEANAYAQDRAERFSPTTQAGASAPSRPELELLKDQLGRRIEYAYGLSQCLERAMDYVCGSAPTPPGTAGAVNAAPDGFIGTVEAGLQHLGELMSRVDHQVSRLERVVG